jgi:hypothetical protein
MPTDPAPDLLTAELLEAWEKVLRTRATSAAACLTAMPRSTATITTYVISPPC